MSRTRSLISILAVAALLAGAGVFVRSTPAASATRAAVAVGASKYGPILFDGRGFALYAFTSDPRRRATCYGDCAKAWPPFVVAGRPAAGRGAKGALIGTTRRSDGKLHATYAGRPLYYYVGDTSPGVVLCQNVPEFGGTWLVLRASGALVR
jgi:predicted lipoprotein with Yx(FWY)xxD motif